MASKRISQIADEAEHRRSSRDLLCGMANEEEDSSIPALPIAEAPSLHSEPRTSISMPVQESGVTLDHHIETTIENASVGSFIDDAFRL